jgi:hypothetical protein
MAATPSPFREIWLESADGQLLCVLINGDVGWMMYLREATDAGFSSRNPDYDGPADAMVEYRLCNGQHNAYPRAWAYPIQVVERAMGYFRERGAPPPFITWHNDSGDGPVIGGAE